MKNIPPLLLSSLLSSLLFLSFFYFLASFAGKGSELNRHLNEKITKTKNLKFYNF